MHHHRATLDRVAVEEVVLGSDAATDTVLRFEDDERDARLLQGVRAAEPGEAGADDEDGRTLSRRALLVDAAGRTTLLPLLSTCLPLLGGSSLSARGDDLR
jgi:hypothetical protein